MKLVVVAATLILSTVTTVSSHPLTPSSTSSSQRLQSRGPSGVSLRGVSYGGSGCPQGSLRVEIQNGQMIPVAFDNFVVVSGPGVASDQSRRFCQFNFDLQYPAGWQYSVASASWDGYAELDSGAKGVIEGLYYFSGSTDQASTSTDITGPYRGDVTKSDRVGWTTWSPCGSSQTLLNVKADVRLSGNKQGFIGLDTANIRFAHKIYLDWRQC